MHAAWQAGKFDHRQRRCPPRPDAWVPETEVQRLAELVGHHTPKEIATLLNREYHQLDGIQRTETAVVVQIKPREPLSWSRLSGAACRGGWQATASMKLS